MIRMREARGSSLYRVILGCFLGTVGSLLLFLAATLAPRMSALLEENAVELLRDGMTQSTQSLEIFVDNMISTLHFAGTLQPDDPADPADGYASRLSLLKRSREDIRNLALFGEDGALLYGTSGALSVSPETILSMEWFQKALEREGAIPYFSQPYVQSVFQGHYDWVISLAKSAEYQANGQTHTGVLLLDIDYAALADLAGDIRLGSSGYAYLMDAGDELIYHPRQQLHFAGLESEDTRAVVAQVAGLCRDMAGGKERVLIVNPIRQTRWRLVGVAYIDEVLRLQSTVLRIFLIVLVCGGILSVGVAALTAYSVTQPIRHLQRKMAQVEAGDLNTTITARGFREIRALSETFNRMLLRIRGLMGQIVQEQEAKRLHELNALQAQINPHFLYNTLDSIIWMEERGRSKEAIAMVSALARLFRISISKGRNLISVREEMEHVRNYLIIQKMRFRNKFIYEINPAEEVLECRTVKLIVQPLVENAVHHAIDALDERTLHIEIRAWREGDTLHLSVRDDGIGIPPDKLKAILESEPGRSGIGLRNVHERIQLTCGREYGLTVESEEDEGTLVILRLPADLKEE